MALLLSVPAAAAELGVGRTTMFKLVRTGEIRTVKIFRRTLIPVEALNEYIARLAG